MDVVLHSNFNNIRLVNQTNTLKLVNSSSSVKLGKPENTVVLRASATILTTQATGGTYTAKYNEVYPVTFYIVPESQALDKISVSITESFNGSGATLKIGTAASESKYFDVSDTDLTTVDVTYEKDFSESGEISLKLTIDPGIGATQGEVQIQISATKQGV